MRVKLFEPIVVTHYAASTPTVRWVDPTGLTGTITPVQQGDTYTVSVRATKLGEWRIIFDSTVYTYDVTRLSAIEERLGVGAENQQMTHVHGIAVAGEFATCYDVAATPLWITRSLGVYFGQPILADTTDRTHLWHHDKLRIPYEGWVTGVRVRLVGALDASNLTMFQFIFFEGSAINSMRVVGRTENIAKSRLTSTDAWIQFQKPVYCRGGEWMGLRVQTSSGTANTVRLCVNQPGVKLAETFSAATDATGTIVTGPNWLTAGVAAVAVGDKVYMTNKGSANITPRTVTAVNSTQMTVTPAYDANQTGCFVGVSSGVMAEPAYGTRNGLVRLSAAPSDTAANTFFVNTANHYYAGFPGLVLMTRPTIALSGDSVMGGTGQTGGGTGTLHDHHVTTEYFTRNDMSNWIAQYTGATAVNASRGGSYVNVYIDKYTPTNPLWGYLNQQWASIAEYRPSVIIYNSIHNDGNPGFGAFAPTDKQYLDALDLMYHSAKQIGAEFIITTGTPVLARQSNPAFLLRCQQMRAMTRHWCARNGVRLIDTERLFHITSVVEGTEDAWHDETVTTVFGRPLYDYYSTDAIHPNSQASDGANAYRTMAKFMAEHLFDPAKSYTMAQMWRLQTQPKTTVMDKTQVGINAAEQRIRNHVTALSKP